jgi:hypothetical protein
MSFINNKYTINQSLIDVCEIEYYNIISIDSCNTLINFIESFILLNNNALYLKYNINDLLRIISIYEISIDLPLKLKKYDLIYLIKSHYIYIKNKIRNDIITLKNNNIYFN